MQKLIGVNAGGLRVGEDHHNAKLTNHEVDLIRDSLDERERFIEQLQAAGYGKEQIRHAVKWQGLDVRSIAAKHDVSPSTVQDIHVCRRRSQPIARFKPVRVPDSE